MAGKCNERNEVDWLSVVDEPLSSDEDISDLQFFKLLYLRKSVFFDGGLRKEDLNSGKVCQDG
jgi:uncharacterized phage-associated protein